MDILTARQAAALDKFAIEKWRFAGLQLMERAAIGTIDAMEKFYGESFKEHLIIVVAGPGNNGGDGFAIARNLKIRGFAVEVASIGDMAHCNLSNDAAINRNQCIDLHIPVICDFDSFRKRVTEINAVPGPKPIFCDAIFGVGLRRKPEQFFDDAINLLAEQKHVVAIDIASGIDATSGAELGHAAPAELTVTYAFPKRGHFLSTGFTVCGKLSIVNLGFPDDILRPGRYSVTAQILDNDAFRSHEILDWVEDSDIHMCPLPPNSHKGSNGRCLIVAGHGNMGGAAIIAATGAYRSGAGVVTVATSEENRTPLLSQLPEAIFTPQTEDAISKHLATCNVVAIGPGLGTSSQAFELFEYILTHATTPIVIDADALNLIAAAEIDLRTKTDVPIILTPHPKEAERLTEIPLADILNDPLHALNIIANKFLAIVLLKNAAPLLQIPSPTIDADSVTEIPRKTSLFTLGNPGMATGGMGDLLTGMIAARVGVRNASLPPAQRNNQAMYGAAVKTAVAIHGIAGSIAAHYKGQISMKTLDVANELTEAWESVMEP